MNFTFLWFLIFSWGGWKMVKTTWIITQNIIPPKQSSSSKNVKWVKWWLNLNWKKCTRIPYKTIKFKLAQLHAIVILYIDSRIIILVQHSTLWIFERKPKLLSCYHHINTNGSKTSVHYINMEYGKENEDDGHLEELSCHSPLS